MNLVREFWLRVTRPNIIADRYLGVVLARPTAHCRGKSIRRPVMVWGVGHGWKIPDWLAHPLVHGVNILVCLRYGHDELLLGLVRAGHIPPDAACCSACGAKLDRTEEARRKLWQREACLDKMRWVVRLWGRGGGIL